MSKKQMCAKNLLYKFLLICTVVSFISAARLNFFNEFFWFDLLMVSYVIIFFIFKRNFNITKYTLNTMKTLFIILFPSIILINFTTNIAESIHFFVQYLFLLIALPLFFESVYKTGQFNFLLKTLLIFLILNSLLFLLVFFGLIGKLYFSNTFDSRFALNGFSPNQMGHYLILMMFLTTILLPGKYKYLLECIAAIPYIMTYSKTVWIQLFLFMMTKRFKIIITISIIVIIIICFSNYNKEILENIKNILSDFSTNTTSNHIRINMLFNAINNIPNSILFPAYHGIDNIDVKYINALSSHFIIASYITNFGLISFLFFLIISMYLIINNIKDKYFRFILLFIFLDAITILFNPIINARTLWFPFFLYIATFNFRKIRI